MLGLYHIVWIVISFHIVNIYTTLILLHFNLFENLLSELIVGDLTSRFLVDYELLEVLIDVNTILFQLLLKLVCVNLATLVFANTIIQLLFLLGFERCPQSLSQLPLVPCESIIDLPILRQFDVIHWACSTWYAVWSVEL